MNGLLNRSNPPEVKFEATSSSKFTEIKVETDLNSELLKHEDSLKHYQRTENLRKKPAGEENRPRDTMNIIRRKEFKHTINSGHTKIEEDQDNEDLHPTGQELMIKKKDRSIKTKHSKNLSKAKHLWVNYGRRIIEYAADKIEGLMQDKLRLLVGKLNSKKDFEKVFQIKSNDLDEDKKFKTTLGNIAIDFVRNKASTTFENSKYKQEMVTQRHTVSAWIERLIGI